MPDTSLHRVLIQHKAASIHSFIFLFSDSGTEDDTFYRILFQKENVLI